MKTGKAITRVIGLAVVLVALSGSVARWSGAAPNYRPGRRTTVKVAFAKTGRDRVLAGYANLPVTFVENRGQIDNRVRYYAQRGNFAAYFTPGQAVYSLGREDSSSGVTLALRFLQANPRVSLEAEDRAPGDVNYFRGNDPERWRTSIPRYSQIVYRELWAGVDLRMHDQAKSLKYEFRVRSGAKVSNIRLAYTGASGIALDPSGALRIDTPVGVLRDAPPVCYQEIDGKRVSVESRYILDASGEYGFAVGAGYRADRELVIDPGLDYSTFLGGADADSGTGIAVDAAGNAYIVGITQSADFPTTVGAFRRTGAASGFTDVFVAKLNPTGTALIYSTFIGGVDLDWGRAIAVDAAGNAYIAGQTKSSDFPTTPGAFDRTLNIPNCPRCGVDNYDAFVAKLNPTGSALVYSTYLGGASDIDDALGIAVDSAGSAYVTGETASADFPVTPGAFRTVRNGADDAYVTKLNPAGSALVYSTFIGGAAVDFGVRIAVDSAHNAYVLGNTSSADFPTTTGAFDTSQNGSFDLFVLKLNASGNGLLYSTFLGGSNTELAGGLALDSAGNVYVTGSTLSLDFPHTPGAFKTVSDGNDGFVTKLNPTGSALLYSTFIGGSGPDGVSGIALDASGNAFLTGTTGSQDFPTTVGAVDSASNGGVDAYVAELSADGSTLLYGTYLGGADSDNANDIALGPAGSVYVTGQTMSTDFPTTAGAFDRIRHGDPLVSSQDAFVARLTPASGPLAPASLSSVSVNPASLMGGNPSGGTVALTATVPAGGAVIALSSNNSAASVPQTITISQGSSGTFPITTSAVTATTTATVTATYNGVSKTASLTLSAPPPPVLLQSVAIFPSSVTGGSPAQATVILTGPTPTSFGVTITATGPVTVPSTLTVQPGSNTVNFTVNTQPVTTATTAVITATSVADGTARSVSLPVNPAQAPPPISSLTLNPASLQGGGFSMGTVTLTAAAPTGGAIVSMSSNSPAATVPSTVTVSGGATSQSFSISTQTVTTISSAVITATLGASSQQATLTITPAAAVTLSALTLNPASVSGGGTSQGTVTLSGQAPSGGAVVTLSSGTTSVATVPAGVTVAAGAASATFAIATSAVTTSTPVTITASAGSVTRTVTLTVTPPGQTATLSVTAAGRNGEHVTSSPAGISVAVGSTMSAPFVTGTAITLTVSNGRDAVWSGACSSGGNKAKNCTFALTGNATVAANVQ
jgi:Beta-propeller repeat